uniref:non-specific serine/threonine protein kinase n=1 Tax=Trichobilharzia regenti TaxID=157069 RepID=A0AA85JI20_TRIRE|nr:unnamed protein product [Trichobilharzia regenti]
MEIHGRKLHLQIIMNKSCLSLSEFQTDQYIDIKERLVALQRHLSDPYSDCYIERLLDVVVACVAECTKTVQTETNSHMESFLQRFLDVARRLELYRRKSEDFSFISSLGHGAFGRVQLVREITTGRVCAMKILKKSRMLDQHADYWAEREIMSNGESPWIVQLYYAYQDLKHLYMVMEYVPGGNLVSWMDEVEFMSEAACRFYAAETILALIDLHAMGFIHRDLKPDNLLLDSGGHLKLADFGTAVRVNPETLLVHCDAAVGTPDYLSPEVLLSQGIGGGSYGFEVDWWALGVVIYEMLYGVTPFYSETLVNTYAHIMNHETYLKFPENVSVSDSCLDFMKNLLCDRSTRLGSQSRDLTEVYNHPWFSVDWIHSQQTDGNVDSMDASIADWTWTNIRACRAPFQPHLTSDTDTSHFQPETDEEDDEYENQNVQLKDENNNVKPKEVAKGDFPESSSSDHKYSARYSEHLLDTAGSQLAFAGFSFSSSHPYHLALLSGLNLPSSSKELINGNTDSLHVSNINTTDNHQQKSDNNDINNKSCESINQLVNNNKESNSSEAKMNHANYESQVARLQMQLEDALTLSDTHLSEVSSLTLQLEQTTIRCRELESKLSLQEINFKKTKEEMERQLENAHAEAAANCSRLEAEVIKWKSLAQSEEAARQSAETAGSMAVATATVQLARRAAEVADRLGRPGTRNSLSRVVSPGVTVLGNDSNSPFDSNIPSDHSDVDAPDNLNSLSLDNPNTATELLINRMEEMARRAHRAENTAQEAADQLEAEKHFKHIYKETCAEKTDQLNEKTRELGVLQELYAQKCKMIQRTNEKYEAALRALDEIQQKVGRYVEAAQSSKESAHAASQRAALASSEAAQLRVELERMTQAYKKEQVKFSATVNKLTEVLSGKNPDTLELMWLASFQQQQQEQDGGSRTVSPFFLGSNSARSKVASLKGLGQQKRLNLQLNQRSKENKRLLSEINRLNDELSTLRKEYENKLRLNESHTVSLESELASLKEQLHSVSIPKSSPSQQDIDDDSLGLRHYHQYHQLPQQQHNLHTNNNSQNNYYQNHQHAQQQLPNHSILLISKQVFNSDNYSNLSNNNNNINGKSNHITECDSAVRKSFVRPSSTIPSTAQSSVSHETNVKYPNVNTNTKLGATKNRASGGNSRNPTELMLPSAIDELIPVDFKFYGILEFGPKRGKRNKLHWESCFAQLTRTHLMLWIYRVTYASVYMNYTINI